MNSSILALIEKTRSIGTWSLDVRKSIATWSSTTYAIHEENPSKVIGLEDGINYYVPEHRSIIENCVQAAIEDRVPWDIELKIRTAKGRLRWVRAIGEPVFEDGKLARLQGVFEDIDKRKQLEVEREELLHRVMQGERMAGLGHWWWHESPDQLQWTPGTYRLHGIPEDESPPRMDTYFDDIHPDDRERIRAQKLGAFESGTSYVVEYRLTRNGTEKYLHSEGFPRHDALGRLNGFFGVTIERTDEVLSKLRIEELNRRLTLALDAAQLGVWEWNLVTNELIWDKYMYRLYGIEEKDFSGAYEAWERGLHPDDKSEAVDTIQRAISERAKFEATFRVLWPNGTVRTIQGLADIVFGEDGEPQRLIGVNRDITALIDAQRELKRSNEELTQFAYRTSHDLKSPLTAIRRLASYMQDDLEEGALDEVSTNVVAIEKRAGAMEEMVAGILNTARADLSDGPFEPIDVEQILKEIAESLSFQSQENDVEITWEVSCPDRLLSSRMRVYQILANLIGNGIKYSSPHRQKRFVRVEAAHENANLTLAVEDNGRGMSTADSEAPFEMFARLDAEASGSGLGLYIVKKHVNALGGTIRFSSTKVGTRFDIELPTRLASAARTKTTP